MTTESVSRRMEWLLLLFSTAIMCWALYRRFVAAEPSTTVLSTAFGAASIAFACLSQLVNRGWLRLILMALAVAAVSAILLIR